MQAPKSRKPDNTAFKQQRLKAWQPILTPKTVLPTFFILGAIFIPLGVGLYMASEKVNEISFDYSTCKTAATSTLAPPSPPRDGISQWQYNGTHCIVEFNVAENLQAPVFMYYRLTNFYQNHRRYVRSFDADQIKGTRIATAGALNKNCDPLRYATNIRGDEFNNMVQVSGSNVTYSTDAQVYPCGLIANSLFSDDISNTLTCSNCNNQNSYDFVSRGIAWPSDAAKYGTTQWNTTSNSTDITLNLIPPPLWRTTFPQYANGYTSANLPDLANDEHFQVWMRTAGLPTFRKLWGKNTDTTMNSGTWQIAILDRYSVDRFSGTKSIVISTISFLGGKNPFLGAAYITVGVICLFLGLVFLLRHCLKPRKLGDHTYLSWNQPQPQRMPGGGLGN